MVVYVGSLWLSLSSNMYALDPMDIADHFIQESNVTQRSFVVE